MRIANRKKPVIIVIFVCLFLIIGSYKTTAFQASEKDEVETSVISETVVSNVQNSPHENTVNEQTDESAEWAQKEEGTGNTLYEVVRDMFRKRKSDKKAAAEEVVLDTTVDTVPPSAPVIQASTDISVSQTDGNFEDISMTTVSGEVQKQMPRIDSEEGQVAVVSDGKPSDDEVALDMEEITKPLASEEELRVALAQTQTQTQEDEITDPDLYEALEHEIIESGSGEEDVSVTTISVTEEKELRVAMAQTQMQENEITDSNLYEALEYETTENDSGDEDVSVKTVFVTEEKELKVAMAQTQEKVEADPALYAGTSSYEALSKQDDGQSDDISKALITDEQRRQMLRDAKRATKEGRLDESIRITDAILKDRPGDKSAFAVKEKATIRLEEKEHEAEMATLELVDRHERYEYLKETKEKEIPYTDKMRFPVKHEWEKIKERVVKEDLDYMLDEGREHTERLQVVPSPTKNLLSQEIRDALSMRLSAEFIDTPLRDVVSFLHEKTKVNFVLDSDAAGTNVDMKLDDVTVNVLLKYILPHGVDLVIKDDVIHITMEPLEMRVYDVRDLLINVADRQPLETTIPGNMTGYPNHERSSTFDRVQEIITLITGTIEPTSWSAGGGRGLIAAREGMLGDIVLTQVSNIHKQVEDLLSSLRATSDIQVNIEARFIIVTDDFLEEYGTNIDSFGNDVGRDHGDTTLSGSTLVNDIFAADSALDLTWSVLDNHFNISGLLSAVQQSEEAEVLTAPNITLTNTQRGRLRVVTTMNYVSSYEIVSEVPQPVISQIDNGTTLNVRPIVSADRKYVYLEVHPEITTVTMATQEYLSTITNDDDVVTATFVNIIGLPQTVVQELSVTVCVPDRGLLLIGGLSESTESVRTKGVPILSKIPLLSRLFSADADNSAKTNLIILIKPTIIMKGEEEDSFFAKAPPRGRIGMSSK